MDVLKSPRVSLDLSSASTELKADIFQFLIVLLHKYLPPAGIVESAELPAPDLIIKHCASHGRPSPTRRSRRRVVRRRLTGSVSAGLTGRLRAECDSDESPSRSPN
eukprot:569860-Hanusia_phi.AAC.1